MSNALPYVVFIPYHTVAILVPGGPSSSVLTWMTSSVSLAFHDVASFFHVRFSRCVLALMPTY